MPRAALRRRLRHGRRKVPGEGPALTELRAQRHREAGQCAFARTGSPSRDWRRRTSARRGRLSHGPSRWESPMRSLTVDRACTLRRALASRLRPGRRANRRRPARYPACLVHHHYRDRRDRGCIGVRRRDVLACAAAPEAHRLPAPPPTCDAPAHRAGPRPGRTAGIDRPQATPRASERAPESRPLASTAGRGPGTTRHGVKGRGRGNSIHRAPIQITARSHRR